MDTYNDLLGQAAKLFDEAKAVISSPGATVEESANADKMMADAQALKARAMKLKDIDGFKSDVLSRVEQPTEDKAAQKPESKARFIDWEDFLKAVFYANHKMPALRRHDPRLQFFKDKGEPEEKKDRKTMVENVGASGGFLVPAEFNADMQAVVAEQSIVRQRATIIRMRRRQVNIPVLDQTGTTAGLPHWFGGMRFYWTEEAAQKTASDPSFRQVELVAHKLIGYTYASDELLDDSAISLADFLAGPLGMAGGISWMEDYAFLRGTGAGQPLGVINAGATISVAAAANPPAPATIYGDLVNMVESFLPTGRGVWVINQRHMSDLLTMNGPTGNASYLWGNAVQGQPNTLLGFPVIWSEKLPAPGSAGSIVLADFRYYLIGDRQATTVESTQYDRWSYDETSWRAVHRVDGQPWLSAPLTLSDGTAQVSPFVILGAKST